MKFIKKNIPFTLFIFFILFYGFQVSEYTYKSDVITFALRSELDNPILEYAYLDSSTKIEGNSLPNYHIGYTIILWALFKINPFNFSSPILLSGIISSIFGALSIVLTYLIAIRIKLSKKTSFFIAFFFGFMPIFWEHSVIGEIHTQQMFFILLFVYTFLTEKFILSSIFFLIANLISPLSGLAFPLIFIDGFDKKKVLTSISVGAGALISYLTIFYLLDINLLQIFSVESTMPKGRGFIYRIVALTAFLLININFYIFFLIKGVRKKEIGNSSLLKNLSFAIIPQVLLTLYSSNFLIEYGSFQIVLFWALAFPLGIYISKLKRLSSAFILAFILNAVITYSIFIYPHSKYGKVAEQTGIWLKENNYDTYKIIGSWANINILYYRNNQKLNDLNKYYIDCSNIDDMTLIKSGEEQTLITIVKHVNIKKILSDLGIPGFNYKCKKFRKKIKCGSTKIIYNNNFITLLYWQK